jgi:hypothetical protein
MPRTQTIAAQQLLAVASDGTTAIAVGKQGTVVTWNGEVWQPEAPTDEDIYAIAYAANEFVAVGGNLHIGGNSLILERSRQGWNSVPSGMQHILLAIVPSEAGWFAAGFNGALIRRVDQQWQRVDFVNNQHIFSLASAGGQLYTAGLGSGVVAYDGAHFVEHAANPAVHLRSIRGYGNGLLAVGLAGTVLRFDGVAWHRLASATHASLEGLCVVGEGEAYAVGGAGTLLRFDGDTWTAIDTGTRTDLYGVCVTDEEIIAVGANGMALHCRR